jgi:integrase
LELRHLRYFVAVAEEGSLTNAAERRLHTAQPSLSRQIRDLELEIGVKLLERRARGIALNAAGRVFLDHARLALMQIEVACEAARGTERPEKPGFVIGFLLGQEAIWLSESLHILREEAPDVEITLMTKRDRALLAVLLACGLRRHEAVELNFSHIQQREEHWAIVDLKGKAGHIRTVPIPTWVKDVLDQWLQAANITSGKLFRRVHKMGKTWGERLTEKAVWHVVREYATKAGIDKLAPHDLRRTCARLCHTVGGELEQIQFLLGHISIQTTERYLGCKQRIQGAVNDNIGIEPSG